MSIFYYKVNVFRAYPTFRHPVLYTEIMVRVVALYLNSRLIFLKLYLDIYIYIFRYFRVIRINIESYFHSEPPTPSLIN